MSDFRHIAKEIAGLLSDLIENGSSISSSSLAEIGVRASGKSTINMYPGVPGRQCHDLCVFISLSSPTYTKGKRGHLNCRQAIEKMVQHMQGCCMGKTRTAILITDSWDSSAASQWAGNLKQIARANHLEIHLIAGRSVSEIRI